MVSFSDYLTLKNIERITLKREYHARFCSSNRCNLHLSRLKSSVYGRFRSLLLTPWPWSPIALGDAKLAINIPQRILPAQKFALQLGFFHSIQDLLKLRSRPKTHPL